MTDFLRRPASQNPVPASDPAVRSDPPESDAAAATRLLLALSHLKPSEAEVETLIKGFAEARAGARSLYAVDEARYALPAQVFSAAPYEEESSLR